MVTRRDFLGAIGLPAASWAIGGCTFNSLSTARAGTVAAKLASIEGDPETIAHDEDFWFEVARAFTPDRSLVNLNNGGVSPSPRIVQEAMKRHLDYSNTAPPYTMWRILEPQRS